MERQKRQTYNSSAYPDLQSVDRRQVLIGLGSLGILVSAGCPMSGDVALVGEEEHYAYLPASGQKHLIFFDTRGSMEYSVEIGISNYDMMLRLEKNGPHFLDILDQKLAGHWVGEFLPDEDLTIVEAELLEAIVDAYFDKDDVPYGDFISLYLMVENVDEGVEVAGDMPDTGL
ncbi:MAG: hypothetical protein HN348_32935 [Proteobacteria bacterium]|jgi:hypothetical protein|nr:hypothetical protein [Pseudomonadota bacterium]